MSTPHNNIQNPSLKPVPQADLPAHASMSPTVPMDPVNQMLATLEELIQLQKKLNYYSREVKLWAQK